MPNAKDAFQLPEGNIITRRILLVNKATVHKFALNRWKERDPNWKMVRYTAKKTPVP